MSPIPCGWYILDVVELIANGETGCVLNFHLVVFEDKSAQQYWAVGNRDLDHMPCMIQLFDVSLFSKHINYLPICLFVFSIRPGTISA